MKPTRMSSKAVLLVLSGLTLSVTGCDFRFGNQIVQQTSSDTVSGYYESAPQTLTYCANVPPAKEKCATSAPNLVPSEISSVMTDPLAVVLKDASTGEAYFVGLGGTNPALPTSVASDRSISFGGSTGAQVLWTDPACTSNLFVQEAGSLTSSGPYTTGSSLKLMGRVQVEIDMIRTFDGDCAASLKAMYDCYLSSNQCGGVSSSDNSQRQAYVQSIFSDWIQAGAMMAADMQTVTKIAYKVLYQ